MKQNISGPVIVGVIIVVVAVIAYFGYNTLKSPKSSMTAEQQKESMRHMIPVKPANK
jgi:hypothetical protein